MLRTTDPSGAFKIEWRCPNCWAKYKKAKATATPLDGVPAIRGFGGEGWGTPSVTERDEPPSSKRAEIELPPSSTGAQSAPGAPSSPSSPSSPGVPPTRRRS